MYNEICVHIASQGWTKVSDPSGNMGPYAYKGNQWVGNDDAFIYTIMYYAAYGYYASLTSQTLDVYTRSYYLGFVNDLYPCFISPMIVLFEAPVIRRKINKFFSNIVKNHLNIIKNQFKRGTS